MYMLCFKAVSYENSFFVPAEQFTFSQLWNHTPFSLIMVDINVLWLLKTFDQKSTVWNFENVSKNQPSTILVQRKLLELLLVK